MLLRLFNVFDKPSDAELADYVEATTLIGDNILHILGMRDETRAEEILTDLERLREMNLNKHPEMIMTHHRLQVHITHYSILTAYYTLHTLIVLLTHLFTQQKYASILCIFVTPYTNSKFTCKFSEVQHC